MRYGNSSEHTWVALLFTQCEMRLWSISHSRWDVELCGLCLNNFLDWEPPDAQFSVKGITGVSENFRPSAIPTLPFQDPSLAAARGSCTFAVFLPVGRMQRLPAIYQISADRYQHSIRASKWWWPGHCRLGRNSKTIVRMREKYPVLEVIKTSTHIRRSFPRLTIF